MVKFAKQLELQLVSEWRGAYCQYKLLKKSLNKIKQYPLNIPDGPGLLTSNLGSPLDSGQSRRKSFWSHIDLIQVHNRKAETGDEDYVYETELLGPIAQSVYDQAFFKSLDAQLNKVNDFYRRKEQEYIQRASILDKQICALAGVKKLLEQGRVRQDEDGASGRRSELGDALMSMEAGYYDQNHDDLLESIAKATLAATGVPSLPFRRKTIESMESSSLASTSSTSLGSTSSSASTEVTVGNLSRNSMNTRANHVKLIIPRTTPAATIGALTQVLWEDVFRQSKRSPTVYKGREDYSVGRKKIQSATLMLRAAYTEFYRGLGLLKSYSSLNVLAFAKIMKKYDKVTGLCVAEKYMHHVEDTYFYSSDKVARLMDKVEEIFTEHFTGGHRRQAMAALRPMHPPASHHVTYFLGFFTGCSVALMAAFGILLRLAGGDYNDKGRINYLHTIFPTFSMLALVLFHMYLYGWNIFLWRRARINYAFIFEFSPGSELRYREVLLVCTALTTLLIGAMVVHLTIHTLIIEGQGPWIHYVDLIPIAVMVVFLAILLNPLNVCYRSSRVFFLNVMVRIICAPLYKVALADFFLADQLTSQVGRRTHPLTYETTSIGMPNFPKLICTRLASHSGVFTDVLELFHFHCLDLCFRRWVEENDSIHMANAGKYLSAMAAVSLKITYSKNPGAGWLAMFFIASTIATFYQVFWDTVIDWGLLRRDSKNKWLRDELLLKRKWIYFASMALNIILRLAWLQSMTHLTFGSLDSSIMSFIFAALEIFRRGHWNFYRLENEHLNNVGKYRATKQVPLPFEDTTLEP